MIGPRMATIQKQIKADKNTRRFNRPAAGRSVYVQIAPSTPRYRRLMAMAERYDVSYHKLALEAIDWYLRNYGPKDI